MEKIKEFFKSAWSTVVVSVGAIFVGLLYLLRRKQDENNKLKAKDKLHEADKQSALLDQAIDQKQKENVELDSKQASNEQQLKDLEAKRKAAEKKEKDRPDDQVEDYWKNN